MKTKKSFFERLTGSVNTEFEDEFEDIAVEPEPLATTSEEDIPLTPKESPHSSTTTNLRPLMQQSNIRGAQIHATAPQQRGNEWMEENHESTQEDNVGQLPVDVYQTSDDIIVKTLVPGVRPENLEVNITRDMIVIRGKREQAKHVPAEHYFHQELYWGIFSRSILLPQEVDTEQAEAVEHNGLLILRLPKINKAKQTKLKIRSA